MELLWIFILFEGKCFWFGLGFCFLVSGFFYLIVNIGHESWIFYTLFCFCTLVCTKLCTLFCLDCTSWYGEQDCTRQDGEQDWYHILLPGRFSGLNYQDFLVTICYQCFLLRLNVASIHEKEQTQFTFI